MREYTQFYINGQWIEPDSPNRFEVINPSHGSGLCPYFPGRRERCGQRP